MKDYIDYIKRHNISKEDAIQLLKKDQNLSNSDKNLIFAYCFPRQLLDRELPIRIKASREKYGYSRLQLDPREVALIIEAGQTEQYRRYIKHLMYSFNDPLKVCPVADPEHTENPKCGICDCDVLYYGDWQKHSQEDQDREYLALGSKETRIILCKHCLIQLLNSINIINVIDPSFLDWTKRYNHNDLLMSNS